jgi:hypothetical protein
MFSFEIRIGIQTKMLDPDPDQMNADPQPWLFNKIISQKRNVLKQYGG